jgi:hypothetical protein
MTLPDFLFGLIPPLSVLAGMVAVTQISFDRTRIEGRLLGAGISGLLAYVLYGMVQREWSAAGVLLLEGAFISAMWHVSGALRLYAQTQRKA